MSTTEVQKRISSFLQIPVPPEILLGADGRQAKVVVELELEDIHALIPERTMYLQRAVIFRVGESCWIVAPFLVTDEMCSGHMPGFPILPLAVAGRALAQVGAVLVAHLEKTERERSGLFTPLVYKVGEVSSEYRDYLHPGDEISLVAEARRARGPVYRADARGYLREQHIFSMPNVHYVVSDDPRLWGKKKKQE